ncbi:MAG: nuclear transport factor 2 family protein [Cyclobacteriaceae bacterium]|jgi:hypothetical protein
MKKYLYSGLIFLICSPVLAQQSKKHAEVMKPIETVFKAMEIGDSALLGSAFYKKVALSTIVLDGSLELKNLLFENDLSGFKKAVAAVKKEPYREPIYEIEIQREGIFAQVWAKYSFYIGPNFHHCGIDAFQLVSTEAGWKIFSLTDTRQVNGCVIPDWVRRKYEGAKP